MAGIAYEAMGWFRVSEHRVQLTDHFADRSRLARLSGDITFSRILLLYPCTH